MTTTSRQPSSSPTSTAGGVLTVDLFRLQENWLSLARRVAPAECAAAVKANAYGLGLGPCAGALWQAGCRTFFVALPQEGATLRRILPEARILVLAGLLRGLARHYLEHLLEPVLGSIEEVEEWANDAPGAPAALQIDTGFNRLGLSPADARRLEEGPLAPRLNPSLVVSHLACGDDPDSPMNYHQLALFRSLRALFPKAPASLANSPGIFLSPDFHLDLVRPGIALYGCNPFLDRPNPMQPVVRLSAMLLQVRNVEAGETVGYGAEWAASRPSRIGILSAGYHDGLRRSLAGGPAGVYIDGRFAPIAGRVSMDLTAVDLTDVPPERAKRGDWVELIGEHATVDQVAAWAGTIPYEVLTGLGSRYARVYTPAPSSSARKDPA
ncbi:MAG: alanine racemase [Parvibaculaceae bacterium]